MLLGELEHALPSEQKARDTMLQMYVRLGS